MRSRMDGRPWTSLRVDNTKRDGFSETNGAGSSFRGDTETSTRDARAPRSFRSARPHFSKSI